MTLWQMMIVAGLVGTFSSPPEERVFNATIALMIMQLYITYLWWSVGLYDKAHRVLNRPYTVIYLLSLFLVGMACILFYLEYPEGYRRSKRNVQKMLIGGQLYSWGLLSFGRNSILLSIY